VFINGELITKEYRSTRSVDALMEYVKKQLEVSIMEFPSQEHLTANMNPDKRNIIAYFHCRDCVEYQNFQVTPPPPSTFPIHHKYEVFRKWRLSYAKTAPSGLATTRRSRR